ncbi:MAG TPA: hypothetical protein VE442_13465 [Jatrophihabitans sp.]|jgi:hypothetical protein|nr:hypothetical protein [Jatrophihabitans sp.]
MSTSNPELEQVIRDALRSEQIGETDLIYPALRSPAPRTHRRVAAAFGAAVVLVVAAVVAVLATNNNGPQHPSAGNPLSGVVGYRWQVTHLVDAKGALPVPATIRAEVGFTRDGFVLGDDTVHALQANYVSAADGYTVHNGAISANGSVGLSPARERTMRAVEGLFVSVANAPLLVTVSFDANGLLTLEHDGVQLTLTRVGRQPDVYAQLPSTTSTSALTPPPDSVLHALTTRARSAATANQDPSATGEAVRTTYGDAERVVLGGDTSSNPPADTDVWVIQLHGSFTCADCSGPPGVRAPTGNAIVLIIDAGTFEGYDFSITKQPQDLASLGTVVQLPM